MIRIYLIPVALVLLSCSDAAPVMSYFNVSNKPIQPRAPQPRKIIPLPYRAPAPVYEVFDEDPEELISRNLIANPRRKPIKYGFVNPKSQLYDYLSAYNYNKRFIYTNLIY